MLAALSAQLIDEAQLQVLIRLNSFVSPHFRWQRFATSSPNTLISARSGRQIPIPPLPPHVRLWMLHCVKPVRNIDLDLYLSIEPVPNGRATVLTFQRALPTRLWTCSQWLHIV